MAMYLYALNGNKLPQNKQNNAQK